MCGRIKDLIIVRGRNHYPQDIERTAERAALELRPVRLSRSIRWPSYAASRSGLTILHNKNVCCFPLGLLGGFSRRGRGRGGGRGARGGAAGGRHQPPAVPGYRRAGVSGKDSPQGKVSFPNP